MPAPTEDERAEIGQADRDDVRLAVGGDTRAFERLYRRHVPRVHSLARRMLGPDLADEVTQDVFVRAWEKLGTFRGEAAFGTWLHRVAINLILAKRKKLGIRRQRFHHHGEAAIQKATARSRRPEFPVEFEGGLQRLPDGARQVFILHDVEGYKHREIAKLLSVTTGTTKAQLHRARMLLRKHISA